MSVLAAVTLSMFALQCRPDVPAALCPGCNVVLISIDTLRADHLGAYGYDRPTTPRVDELARRSIVFENAVSQSAWTRPAHASMLTGLYPSEHGIVAMEKNIRLSSDLPTLASSLTERGYVTAAFTGGANMSAHYGFDVGFELYASPGRRIEDSLDGIAHWLEERPQRPYFLLVHGFDAHRPYKSKPVDREALGLAAERAVGLQRACRDDVGPAAMVPFIAEYDAAIHRADRAVGRLLDLIESRGEFERTVIVLTSDHGEEFLEHGRCFHIRTLHDEIVSVPLIIHIPGQSPRRVRGVVPASVSLPATLLDVVGFDGKRSPGPSLAAVLGGDRPRFGYVVSETMSRYSGGRGIGHVRALVGDHEKLFHFIDQRRYFYYDLRRDPHELSPIEHGSRLDELAGRLERWSAVHARRGASVAAGPVPVELASELRALGYID